ncbi:MAG: ATPase, partial [Defluviitaleaceae bacterium]|nr:ATPase [Defluviitaleaceae bacterium]
LRRGRLTEFLFGANGMAGLMFYAAVIWVAMRVIQGSAVTTVVITVTILPLIFVCFKHPLENLLSGGRAIPKGDAAAFVGRTAIELFETLLTYATNTVSFVRVGAFAVSHVSIMHVVLQLSQGAASAGGIVVLILGNILVLVIEGLLVGIQVLRLDFYELFSRFYKGTGHEFVHTYRNEG